MEVYTGSGIIHIRINNVAFMCGWVLYYEKSHSMAMIVFLKSIPITG